MHVVGLYALAMAAVERERAPRAVGRGGSPAIPVALLARLGVDTVEQGRGLGGALLKDAIKRAARAADEVGARALLAHAKDARAQSFYEHFDFEASHTDQLHMYLRLTDALSDRHLPGSDDPSERPDMMGGRTGSGGHGAQGRA